jgi:hypothetical protein
MVALFQTITGNNYDNYQECLKLVQPNQAGFDNDDNCNGLLCNLIVLIAAVVFFVLGLIAAAFNTVVPVLAEILSMGCFLISIGCSLFLFFREALREVTPGLRSRAPVFILYSPSSGGPHSFNPNHRYSSNPNQNSNLYSWNPNRRQQYGGRGDSSTLNLTPGGQQGYGGEDS